MKIWYIYKYIYIEREREKEREREIVCVCVCVCVWEELEGKRGGGAEDDDNIQKNWCHIISQMK